MTDKAKNGSDLQDDQRQVSEDDAETVSLPIEDHLDLHTFLPRDVLTVVEEYLFQCRERGLKEVRLIHGRGKGVQRQNVQRFLRTSPLVERFYDAPPERGGWGATVVILKIK